MQKEASQVQQVQPLFTCVPAEDCQRLLAIPCEAECIFIDASQGHMEFKEANRQVVLQVAGQYVLQRGQLSGNIVSYFQCDYEIQFEIVRKPVAVTISIMQSPGTVGEATGIRFCFKQKEEKVQLTISAVNKDALDRFGEILGRKYIVQLGFHTSFRAIKKIGKGMTACVFNALNFATNKEVAIKSFKRSTYFATENNNGKLSFQKEFRILTEMKHKNICELLSVYETDNSTYIIMELLPFSLYGYLQKYGFPSENRAKKILIGLLEGISHMHDKGIMHRDLKLENIMIRKDDLGNIVPVVVDMGLAEYTANEKYLYTRCGTPGYVAPQVLQIKSTDHIQTYTSACDIFSIGVIFHILLFRKPLFEGKEIKDVIRKNSECNIDFNAGQFQGISEQAREFFKCMLCKDPLMRFSAREALNHAYLQLTPQQKLINKLSSDNIFSTNNSIKELEVKL